MDAFAVANPERIALILRAFACLDDIRWKNRPNYNLINYCSDDLTADEKLLTHWLSYITDRQMPFMRVWEIGGNVISHLVRAFERSDCRVSDLAPNYVQRRDTDAVHRQDYIGCFELNRRQTAMRYPIRLKFIRRASSTSSTESKNGRNSARISSSGSSAT